MMKGLSHVGGQTVAHSEKEEPSMGQGLMAGRRGREGERGRCNCIFISYSLTDVTQY